MAYVTAQRPKLFAAAVACCAGDTNEDAPASLGTPLWNFHGDSDKSVPVTLSRDRITALRKVGGHPIYTEYAGVDHNAWQWGLHRTGVGEVGVLAMAGMRRADPRFNRPKA